MPTKTLYHSQRKDLSILEFIIEQVYPKKVSVQYNEILYNHLTLNTPILKHIMSNFVATIFFVFSVTYVAVIYIVVLSWLSALSSVEKQLSLV